MMNHLKNGHAKELHQFTRWGVASERTLHVAPVPELVDEDGWAGEGLKDL